MIGGIRIPWLDEGTDRGLAWAAAGLGIYLVAGIGSMFVVAAIHDTVLRLAGLDAEPGTVGWGLYLASMDVAWIVLGATGSAWIGRRLIAGLRLDAVGPLLILGAGLVLAGLTTLTLHEWIRARYEVFDPEYAGPVFFAAPAVVAASLAGWAALALPPRHRRAVQVELVLAGVAFAVAALPTLGGLTDGLSSSGVALALALGLDGVFVSAVIVAATLARRS
jgi:hypothetical protein